MAIPVDAEGPMVKGLQDMGFRLCPRDPSETDHDEVEVECPDGEDPMAVQEEEEDEEAAEAEVLPRQEAEQRWKEFIASDNGVESRVLTFAVPLVSRKAHHVVEQISWIYARVRSMDIPILRVHTDRAREFASSSFTRWCSNKSILHTMSPGDEPTQNARVERTIGLLKNRVRTLIKASGASISWWPLALRHAAENMLRSQLWQLGIATPTIPGFGVRAVAKSKTWHHRGVPWKFPGIAVRIWGPACDMSITSGGVVVQDSEGRWLRTTVARPTADPEVDDYGKVVDNTGAGESKVPNNRAGGSHPMTLPPTKGHDEMDPQADRVLAPSGLEERLFDEEASQPEAFTTSMPQVKGAEDLWDKFASQLGAKQEANGCPIAQEIEVEPVTHPSKLQGYDPPRFRLQGKQAAQQHPALRVTRAGGECMVEGIKLLQHQGFKRLVQEEASRLQDGGVTESDSVVLQAVHSSLQQLEGELTEMCESQDWEIKVRSLKVEEEQVLQTQTIGLDVVRQNLQDWIPAFKTEADSILSTGAMEVISDEKYRELLKQHPDLERLPMLAVATKKPPNKRKGQGGCLRGTIHPNSRNLVNLTPQSEALTRWPSGAS